jgi:hypothetical protein
MDRRLGAPVKLESLCASAFAKSPASRPFFGVDRKKVRSAPMADRDKMNPPHGELVAQSQSHSGSDRKFSRHRQKNCRFIFLI